MRFTLKLLPVARRELEEAALWYENERRGLGEDFMREVERALDLVREHPERFPDVHRGLRRIRVRRFPYSVIFRVDAATVIVYAVFHARRDPLVWESSG